MKRGAALVTLVACAALVGAAPSPLVTGTPEPVAPTPASCTPQAFAPAGTRGPRAGTRGPALMLAGAGLSDVPAGTLPWLRAHVRGPRDRHAGNVVILKASGERYYSDDFYRAGNFAWVQEVLIPPCASPAQVDAIAPYVDDADVVLFAGGDQSHYVAWKNSALIRAVRRLYARGGIVGGGSAGLAIQGEAVYDSVAANRVLGDGSVTTPIAVRDPLGPAISFTTGMFDWPPLRRTITDTHFVKRDRFGRLVVYLARMLHDGTVTPGPMYGLGVDEGSAVLVERDGTATVRIKGKDRGAYLIRLGRAARLLPGTPFRAGVDVAHVARDGERFDLLHKRTSERWYTVTVEATRTPPYDTDPYR